MTDSFSVHMRIAYPETYKRILRARKHGMGSVPPPTPDAPVVKKPPLTEEQARLTEKNRKKDRVMHMSLGAARMDGGTCFTSPDTSFSNVDSVPTLVVADGGRGRPF